MLRTIALSVALGLILSGLFGPQLAPKNLATVFVWLHFRGFLILGLLTFGNFFCLTCPFILVRDAVRRWRLPAHRWPHRLRNKWPAALSLGLFLFLYERLDLWAHPAGTAAMLLAYFAAAAVIGVIFQGAAFCHHLCPLGQFNLVASLLSPFEVGVRHPETCAACPTHDCLRGRGALPGCEPGLFQPQKYGNMNCHWRLACLRACPYDNIGLRARLPGRELWADPRRSGIGHFSRRPDLAALCTVFTFGALVNAFGMVSPVYKLERALADALNTRSETLVLGLIDGVGIFLLPAVLLGMTAWTSRRLSADRERLVETATRYAYALVPLGMGVWTAHFAFHFLTGFWTLIPVVQNLVRPLLGNPQWGLGPLIPPDWLYPLELGCLGLGWFGSLQVARQIASRHHPDRAGRAFLPWALLITLLLAVGLWLIAQPMEMRGTFLSQVAVAFKI